MTNKTRKAGLACSAAVLAMSFATQALAQSADVTEVVVTGTRVRTPNLESPAPITTLNEQMLAYTGKTNVQQMVAEVGALVGSVLFFVGVGYAARLLARPLSKVSVWRWINLGIGVLMLAMAARLATMG